MTKETMILFAVMVAIAGCRYAPKESALLAKKPYAIATAKTVETQGEPRPIEAQPDIEVSSRDSELLSGQSRSDRIATLGTLYEAEPENAELLYESGDVSLFAGETDTDIAFNAETDWESRNSLFLKRSNADGSAEWRLLLTTGSDWHEAAGMDEWCSFMAGDVKRCFLVSKASFSSDGRHLWLVCNPHTSLYYVACSYDVYDHTLRVLIDGDTADEQPDGTILVKNKKFYPNDDLGAAWHDVWITPDGTIVRKGPITLRGADL